MRILDHITPAIVIGGGTLFVWPFPLINLSSEGGIEYQLTIYRKLCLRMRIEEATSGMTNWIKENGTRP